MKTWIKKLQNMCTISHEIKIGEDQFSSDKYCPTLDEPGGYNKDQVAIGRNHSHRLRLQLGRDVEMFIHGF